MRLHGCLVTIALAVLAFGCASLDAAGFGTVVPGSNVLDGSLVPVSALDASVGTALGFAFVNPGGFLMAGTSASGPGAIENLPALQNTAVKPTRVVVVRWNNHELVTPTNPIHPNDYVEIYLTGMGATTPVVDAGLPGPASPLALVTVFPTVRLGGYPLTVTYAGLAPGCVGVYQIDAFVPHGVPLGIDIPLAISQGSASTSVDERVVN